MGILKSLNRFHKAERSKIKAIRLSKELQKFYAVHPMAPWQMIELEKVRGSYELAQKKLDMAHNMASSRTSEEYMQLELDMAYALHDWRENHPNEEYVPKTFSGFFKKAFWKNLLVRAERLGVIFNHGEAETK